MNKPKPGAAKRYAEARKLAKDAREALKAARRALNGGTILEENVRKRIDYAIQAITHINGGRHPDL